MSIDTDQCKEETQVEAARLVPNGTCLLHVARDFRIFRFAPEWQPAGSIWTEETPFGSDRRQQGSQVLKSEFPLYTAVIVRIPPDAY